mgnify:CR=1 FL=1
MSRPKFMLCQNPLKGGGQTSIIHNFHPFIKADVFHFDIKDFDAYAKCEGNIVIGEHIIYDPEYIVLKAVHIEGIANLADIDDITVGEIEKLHRIMHRMADWYRAYLIWADQQIAKDDG